MGREKFYEMQVLVLSHETLWNLSVSVSCSTSFENDVLKFIDMMQGGGDGAATLGSCVQKPVKWIL